MRKPFDRLVENLFVKHRIDIGRWFDNIPKSNFFFNTEFVNTKYLNNHIVNVPTHFTLQEEDFKRIEKLFFDIKKNGY